ncbi:hypothetical protein TanjilG_28779 [Lupinus angustifolius]|uniref:Rapid ALkalinization Factor n=1 Tax=Lupinus angustifolius TaxID=3871 RepID=A0A394D8I0_LUPAN|nr:hypothetical protein TanjilG_28779 [Lupinus angustifolius]
MKVLFLCALLLSMAMLNQGVMGHMNVKDESCKNGGQKLPGCNGKKPYIKPQPYTRGCSAITKCRDGM